MSVERRQVAEVVAGAVTGALFGMVALTAVDYIPTRNAVEKAEITLEVIGKCESEEALIPAEATDDNNETAPRFKCPGVTVVYSADGQPDWQKTRERPTEVARQNPYLPPSFKSNETLGVVSAGGTGAIWGGSIGLRLFRRGRQSRRSRLTIVKK